MEEITGSSSSETDEIIVLALRDMKIVPNDSDMKKVTTKDPALLEEEEELYLYASMMDKSGGRITSQQPGMNKMDRKALIEEIDNKSRRREEVMMNEIDNKSRSHEEAMMSEMKSMSNVEQALFRELKESKEQSQSELKVLHTELMVVSLACIGISFAAFFTLKR